MGQDPKKVERLYDSLAKEYAETFAGEHQKKPMDREVLLRFSNRIKNLGPIWDLGCGPGHTTQYLHNLGVRISGLDLSKKILEQASHRYPEINFQKGSLLGLEFEENSIAGAVAFYSIVHFTKEQAEIACREIFRTLKPGGLLLLTYHVGKETIHLEEFLNRKIDIDFMLFATDDIFNCLQKNGFEEIETIEREPYPDLEYQSKRAYVFAKKPN